MEVAQEIGCKVIFLGAYRNKDLNKSCVWSNYAIQRIGIYYKESSWTYLIGTPVFAIAVFAWLFVNKPDVIHASDVEGMIGVYLYRFFGGKAKIIFNIYDNYGLRYNVPPWIKKILNGVESCIGAKADVVIVPDRGRLKLLQPWVPKNFAIIPNSPEDYHYVPVKYSGELKIFATGWLNWQRGYKLLGDLLLINENISLIVCGSGDEDVISYLSELPRTEIYGYLPQKEAMALGQACHLFYSYYDPTKEINRYASPNKVYDALMLGRPILINTEAVISDWIIENEVGFSAPYGNLSDLSAVVDRITKEPNLMKEYGVRARQLYESEFSWEKVKKDIGSIFDV